MCNVIKSVPMTFSLKRIGNNTNDDDSVLSIPLENRSSIQSVMKTISEMKAKVNDYLSDALKTQTIRSNAVEQAGSIEVIPERKRKRSHTYV
ncbi:hypothetical protein GJ496_008229 [Pomphorhynchus laevis]|nr:hypothetical protein GJ496_008229 [Pomphorhynchus laevis]